MNSTFDIFRGLPDGYPVWLEAVQGFADRHQNHQIHRNHQVPPHSPRFTSSESPPSQVSSVFSGTWVAFCLLLDEWAGHGDDGFR